MEVNLLAARKSTRSCMPGGKIAYTGILDQLKLTDDEAAMIMRHVAHALREHARARIAKARAPAPCRHWASSWPG
jgi:hypothetical protein